MLVCVHIGLLDDMVGVAGAAFTVTFCVATAVVHPPETTYNEYTPDMAVVAPVRVGLWTLAVHPPGPDHT
jgi:hypothetical protein